MAAIVDQVQQIDRLVGGIVVAPREQSSGLKEINAAVNTMDQSTQHNAAMAEQSTAASHSLAKEAAALNGLMAQFRVGSDEECEDRRSAPVAIILRPRPRRLCTELGSVSGQQSAEAPLLPIGRILTA